MPLIFQWVDNILDHEKETERIVFEDPDKEIGFVLLPDLKWDGHNVESLYLIAIVHKRGIHSIRELDGDHLPMLKKIKQDGTVNSTFTAQDSCNDKTKLVKRDR